MMGLNCGFKLGALLETSALDFRGKTAQRQSGCPGSVMSLPDTGHHNLCGCMFGDS